MGGDPRGAERGVTPERVLAVAGLAALLLVGLAMVLTIAGALDGEGERRVAAATPTPAATSTPTPTPTPEPTPRPYTRSEREARASASETVRSRGFTVTRLRDYDPRSTLRVLIGRDATGGHLAFFFVEDDYVANDATEPSARLRVRSRRDRQVTLAYGVYAPDDERCCPTGGPVTVRFRLAGSGVAPVDPMPPPEQRAPAYRSS